MHREHLALSIRVLSAIALDKREPEPEDAEKIRRLARSERERQMPIDELACKIVERERVYI